MLALAPRSNRVQDPLWDRLRTRLVQRRKELGLTQLEVDHRIGCTECLVGKWEARMHAPSLLFLLWWANALELDLVLEDR